MSSPRFLADEDLRRAIVVATRRLEPGLEFARAVDLGLAAAPDAAILEFAFLNGWLVVSHDVNTMKAAAEGRLRNGQGLSGLFLVPQARPTRAVADSLVLIWSASEAADWLGQIVYLPL